MNKKTWLLAPLLVMALSSCGQKENQTAQKQNVQTQKENVLIVAVEQSYPPYVQALPKNGFEGLDVDILNAIAAEEGLELKFQAYIWDGIFSHLNNGEVDIIASGMTFSEKRQQEMSLTEPYHETTIALITPQDSPIQSFKDAKGKRISYLAGSSSEGELKKIQGIEELDNSLGEESSWLAIKRVMATDTSKVDAALGNSSSIEYYANQYKDANLRIVYDENWPRKTNIFAVKKGNDVLLTKLNRGLEKLKANGTIDKLKTKWMLQAS